MAGAASSSQHQPPGSGRVGALWELFWRFGPPRWSQYIRRNWAGQRLVIAVPYLWLVVFFLVPFLIVLKISFAQVAPNGVPPYEPILRWMENGALQVQLLFSSYGVLLHEKLYVGAWLFSIKVSAISTLLCLLIAYPMAYAIARASATSRNVLLMLVILPFWTSFLLRVYAWTGLLRNNGVINNLLQSLGIIDEPIVMMGTSFAVYIGIVYSYLPFMILPIYTNLQKHDLTLLEAAADLGAGPVRSFLRITLPLSRPGVVAGCLLVFIPVVGEYVIPAMLGGPDQRMIASLLYDQFALTHDWPRASAVAVAMLVLLVGPIMIFQRVQNRELRAAAK